MKDCLRLAQQPETAPEWAMKCRAQANAMMRQANGALRLLLRMQAFRHKIEADYPARDRIARIEHVATALMAEALAQPPVRSAAVSAAWRAGGPRSDRPPSEPAPPEQPTPTPEPATPDAEEADLVAAAERYAALYPERAAAIRRAGRLPADIRYFSPPEAALAPALIAADTPALAALDGFPIAPNLTPAN